MSASFSNKTSSSKHSKSPQPTSNPSSSSSSSRTSSSSTALSSHLAMVELKSRILSSLAKLSDRDTHQIAVDDLEKIIRTLPADGVPMLINSLLHDPSSLPDPNSKHPPLVARRESLRLLSLLAASHPDAAATHLPKIMAHIVRRLKDPNSDSSVRDACRDAAGSLSALYLRPAAIAAATAAAATANADENGGGGGGGSSSSSLPVVALFVKPLFEAMGEQSKVVQGGAATCLAKIVECAGGKGEAGGEGNGGAAGSVPAAGARVLFQRMCSRICKYLGAQSFLAKGPLLSVISSLAQVGAISPQSMQPVLQSIRECLDSSDWTTRKAAADTLCVLASHSIHLIGDGATSTLAALEACRFDKVKPVRDSMMEALQLWKKIAGKGEDETSQEPKGDKNSESAANEENLDHKRSNPVKDSSASSSPVDGDSVSEGKGSSIPEKAAVLLKKAPTLTDKEFNPEFFQKLENRSLDEVEVVVPRKCLQSSESQGEDADVTDGNFRAKSNNDGTACQESNDTDGRTGIKYQKIEKKSGAYSKLQDLDDLARDKRTEQRGFRAKDSKVRAFDGDDRIEIYHKDSSATRMNTARADGPTEGAFMNNKGNWAAIQRQLAQLERQQINLMNMLQDFMGGSHDSMVTLENRVRGLERVVEDMARDLAVSSGRRGGNMMLGSSKYNGFHEYSSSKFGRGGDGRILFAERFLSSDGIRGRDPPWRSDSESWDSYAYTSARNGPINSRRGLGVVSVDGRVPRNELESEQAGNRRAWDKGQGLFRLGEGPSARSVWQAAKDEATLEAIRVAGEDNGTSRIGTRAAIPELDAEALTDDNPGQDRGPVWASWTRAMDSLHEGDMDSAYAEVLSTGDDVLLVKLMDRSGPVVDQLSNGIASEVLRAVGQFILDQSLFDIALSWLYQLADLVVENGADFLGIPLEGKREILFNLHEASAMEVPENWEGPLPDQIMMHLASSWGINLQQLIK